MHFTRLSSFRSLVLGVLVLGHVSLVHADAPKSIASTQKNEHQEAVSSALKVIQSGPTDVKLIDQAFLKLPEGYGFIPSQQAGRLMRSMGNVMHEDPVGMIVPLSGGNWFVVVRFDPAGYIKDDDAKDWNAEELLTNIKDGTEEANKERKSRGISELEVLGWVEPPKYNAASHQLVWSISSRDKGDLNPEQRGINYNTYALGRDGFISMNLVTDLKSIEEQKPIAHSLLAGLEFGSGKRYADFNASTDKVAAYGLAALVGGLAAKKLGLLAVIAAFFIKFSKVFILAGLAIAAGFGKWWASRKNPKT